MKKFAAFVGRMVVLVLLCFGVISYAEAQIDIVTFGLVILASMALLVMLGEIGHDDN